MRTTAYLVLLVFSASCAIGGEDEPPPEDGSAGAPPDAGQPGREICDRYLACAAATNPMVLPELQQGFGPDGSCFESGPTEQCESACRKGLSQLRFAANAHPACSCRTDQECLEPGHSVCDPLNGVCGSCGSSDECGPYDACIRSPRGATCASCDDGPGFDSEACGQSAEASPQLWSAAHVCVIADATPLCVECVTDADCGHTTCDPATARCNRRSASCMGIWECLRRAPVECGFGDACCSQDRCPAATDYVRCMVGHCADCSSGAACFDCSVAHCTLEYQACDAACGS